MKPASLSGRQLLLWAAVFLAGIPSASHFGSAGALLVAVLLGAAHSFALSGLLFVAAGWAGRRGWPGRLLAALAGGVLLMCVAADAWAYGLTGDHLGPNNLGHLFEPGAGDTLGLTAFDLGLGVGLFAVGCALGFFAARPRPVFWRLLLAAFLLELGLAGLGAAGNLLSIAPLADSTGALPFFWQPDSASWRVRLGLSLPAADGFAFSSPPAPPGRGRRLAARRPEDPPSRTPDVLLVVVESLRADALAAMPHLRAIEPECLVDEAHFTGGNCTHLAMFSMLTGLEASYWPAEGTQHSPAGLGAFEAAGYEILYKRGASLNFDLAAHALPGGEREVVDTPPVDPVDRDDANTRWALDWIARPRAKPGFAILFLDSSHWPYWLREDRRIPPVTSFAWTDARKVEEVHARYLQSVAQIDECIGQLIDALRAGGRWNSTALIVTGDHGEAFREHGVLMHGSRLDAEQIRVPLLMHLPGQAAGRLPSPTFHQDLLPTLLGSLGARIDPQPGEGIDLLHGAGRVGLPVVAACGVLEPEGYALIRGSDKLLFQFTPTAAVPLAANGSWAPDQARQALGEAFTSATALLAPEPTGAPP